MSMAELGSIHTKKENARVSMRRLIIREASASDISASEEEYYGEANVAVPFKWETQPGTPKRLSQRCDSPVPPLTPPPSYFYACSSPKPKPSSLLGTVFRKNGAAKWSVPLSPASSSSSSSSSSSGSSQWPASYSLPSSPMRVLDFRRRNRVCGRKTSFESREDEEEEYESRESSPVCFGFGSNHNNKSRGCYASVAKMLLRDPK